MSELSLISWKQDLLRALGIVVAAAILGLTMNAFSRKPVPLLASNGPGAQPEKHQRIGVEQLKTALQTQQVLILDVRKEAVFNRGHPARALSIPAEKFDQLYGQWADALKNAELVVVLCDSEECPNADRVAKKLQQENVRVLHDGWRAYKAAGLEISGGAP
jgi:rhodanese-related sulfurtransferase